ncbi:MAG: DNA polymerase III subunit delta' [Planctomycetes bacterium]|nr:DNA polymerase III subunit delta' [Planctomycetota bacterium]
MHFRDVKHQDRAISILRRGLESGRTHHAYLFDGPEGVGKELTARALAARLLCEGHGGGAEPGGLGFAEPEPADVLEPCGSCTACRLMQAETHPDFHFIDRTLHKHHPDSRIRKTKGIYLVIDVVRHFLISRASAAPTRGVRRVFVVRDAERMNEEAQNALLKTLEEPPGASCLILVTSAASRLLSTIRSRCQRIPFDLLPPAFVQQKLRESGVEESAARTLAGLAQGRLGVALHWSRLNLVELVERVMAALSRPTHAAPEAFSKELLEVAGELVKRQTALERAAAGLAEEDEEETQAAADPDDDDEEAPEDGKAASKKIATDKVRDALKIALSIVSATLRDALVTRGLTHSGASSAQIANSRLLSPRSAVVDSLAGAADEIRLAERIRAVSTAEWMIDANVSPALACDRLAIALGDAAPEFGQT